jgi:predicted NBD/HSP70 family sugar kinase
MDYFAGLDVSMEETHVCVVDRDGAVIHEVKVPSTPADIKPRWPERLPVDGSCSRPAVWPRCSITA